MRWHVHGTDAVTGEDLELAINEPEAEQAVKAAIDRRIVVSHVTAESAYALRRLVKWFMGVAVLGLTIGACWLVSANTSLRRVNASLNDRLDDAAMNQKHMGRSLAAAEQAAANIRARGYSVDGSSEQMKKLQDDLAAARSRMSLTEQQLSATHQQRNDMEAAAARLPEVEAQAAIMSQQVTALLAAFNDSEKQVAQLRRELELANTDLVAKQASLEGVNGELEKIKEELLVAVAKANMPVMQELQEPRPAASVMPWALRVSYDAARRFLALHTDPPSVTTRAGGLPGDANASAETTGGVLPDNAVRMRFVHDKEKGHVYVATMILSVAADAPKEKATENVTMMAEFLKEFVPGVQDAEGIVAAAVKQAGSLNEERRALFLTQDCRVTAWVNQEGLLTLQVEAAREAE